MSPERWQKARQIFAGATEKAADDRTLFVQKECSGDRELLREVETLLAHHEQPNDLFNAPAIGPAAWLENSPPPSLEGQRFGKYDVIREIGSGGMGVVYLAEDTGLHREVALKLLPSWATQDQSWISRFEQEAFSASRLNHPNVPVVYDAGKIDGRYFIATEFVNGMTLAKHLEAGPLPWREALRIAIPVGRGLMAAHAHKIIHRDVKPGNILLGKDGAVKLTDFGIAKLEEDATQGLAEIGPDQLKPGLTKPGLVMGTPDFMSPEQKAGLHVDHGTDIWSLGTVIREMISGDPAYKQTHHGEHHHEPAALRAALRRATEEKPDQRFATMAEFVAALDAIASPRRATWSAILVSPRFWALTSCFLLLAAFVSWRMFTEESLTHKVFKIGKVIKLTNSGNVAEAAISPDGRYLLYITLDNGERTIRLRDVATSADRERLPAKGLGYKSITFARDGKSFYYVVDLDPHNHEFALYKAALAEGPGVKLIEDVDSPAAVSPDGKYIEFSRAVPEKYRAVFVANADGSGVHEIARRSYPAAFLTRGAVWTGDGSKIITSVTSSDRKVALFAVGLDGSQEQLSPWLWGSIEKLNALANPPVLIFAAAEKNLARQVYQFSLLTHAATPMPTELSDPEYVSTSDQSIVLVQRDLSSAIWKVRNGHTERITQPSGQYRDVSWTPDGSLLASANNLGALNISRFAATSDATEEPVTHGTANQSEAVSSPDGKWIVFVSDRGGGRLHLWMSDHNGNSLRQLTSGPGVENSPSFTRDGAVVYYQWMNGKQSIDKLYPATGKHEIILAGATAPRASPSGKYLLCRFAETASGEKWVVADLASRNIVYRFPNIPADSLVRWAANEKSLLFVKTRNGVSNIFIQPVTEGEEKPLTPFEEYVISSFDMSPDGSTLAVVRGPALSDAVLWENQP